MMERRPITDPATRHAFLMMELVSIATLIAMLSLVALVLHPSTVLCVLGLGCMLTACAACPTEPPK
jgi:hypothetical protein